MAENSLQQRLRLLPIKKIADDAKVSTSTITNFLKTDDSLMDELNERGEGGRASRRKFKGFVQSLVKLCMFAGLNPYEVLKEYGELPFKEDQVAIILDEVCGYLGYRQTGLAEELKIGVCKWDPFFLSSDKAENSWGGRFSTRLFRSLKPSAELTFSEIEDLGKAVGELTSSSREAEHLDAIFGLYETPSRVFDGVEFIELLGIEAKLGGLIPGQGEHSWASAFNNLTDSSHPLVIDSDISLSFIVGAVGIDPDKCTILPSFDLDTLYEAFIDNYHNFVLGTGLWCPVLAEQNTINKLASRLKIDLKKPDSAISKILLEDKTNKKESLNFADYFSVLLDDDLISPSYKVGIAIANDSKKLNVESVRFALKKEIYQNASYITAKEYLRLIKNDSLRGCRSMNITPDSTNEYPEFWSHYEALSTKPN